MTKNKELENSVPKVTKSTQKGLAKGWTRATFIVDEEINEKIKALAYWDRVTVKEIVHSALTKHLQGRNIKPRPKKRVGKISRFLWILEIMDQA